MEVVALDHSECMVLDRHVHLVVEVASSSALMDHWRFGQPRGYVSCDPGAVDRVDALLFEDVEDVGDHFHAGDVVVRVSDRVLRPRTCVARVGAGRNLVWLEPLPQDRLSKPVEGLSEEVSIAFVASAEPVGGPGVAVCRVLPNGRASQGHVVAILEQKHF